LRVHFYNSKPALIAKTYQKTIKVAYYRPLLHIQEDYEIHHEGAKLKGQFSQIDLKLNRFTMDQTSAVQMFTSIIPPTATDVYYKDLAGNVSTSNLRYEKKKAVLELRPRYPLYGGWKYTWFHGYTIPQEPFLKKVGAEDYTLKTSLIPSVKGFAIDHCSLKVILPEGAT
jgi:oligosaccharyltransferase complex subunit alpha (ribophorin I)